MNKQDVVKHRVDYYCTAMKIMKSCHCGNMDGPTGEITKISERKMNTHHLHVDSNNKINEQTNKTEILINTEHTGGFIGVGALVKSVEGKSLGEYLLS